MPKSMIAHSCGHVFRHNVTGDTEKRARRRAWLEEQLCVNCRRKDDKIKVTQFIEENDLPPLKPLGLGDKDVGWAESIRMGLSQKLFEQFDRQHDQIRRIVKSEKSARYWLGRHRANPLSILYELSNIK